MKNRKHGPILFSYRDCDDFAAYLEEQAGLGWHLKKFIWGWFFERSEPAEEKSLTGWRCSQRRGEGGQEATTGETERYTAYCEGGRMEICRRSVHGNSPSLSRWKRESSTHRDR